jgi:membrane protein YdbS with pleckstrin-like domain
MPDTDTADIETQDELHESSASFAMRIVLLQLILALASASLTLLLFYLFSPVTEAGLLATLIILINIALHTVDAGVLVYLILRWKKTTYSITSGQIAIHKGSANERTKIFNIHDLEDVEVTQSPFGKVFNYGTVSFKAPNISSRIELPNIPKPWHYAKLINKLAQKSS